MLKVSAMTGNDRCPNVEIPVEMSRFPCGERNLRIGEPKAPANMMYTQLNILLEYQGDTDLIDLMLLVDAIKRCPWLNYQHLILLVNYFPYGRQDRVCNNGEAHSMRVISSMINSCGFDKVFVIDPHSDVVEALIDNVDILDLEYIVFASEGDPFVDCDAYVSPDGGAYKKVTKAAKVHGKPIVRADKIRDTQTGALSGFEVYADDLTGQSLVILDDICDGGGTFIGLAKKLREKGAEKITLYVTHGKFTKGVEALKEFIDEIYCYDYTGPEDQAYLVHELELFNGR